MILGLESSESKKLRETAGGRLSQSVLLVSFDMANENSYFQPLWVLDRRSTDLRSVPPRLYYSSGSVLLAAQ